jgi:hypothetical protein
MNDDIVYLLGIPVYFWSILVLVPTIAYAFIWPKKLVQLNPHSRRTYLFLRWGHSFSWLMLALALFAWASHSTLIAILLAIAGAAIYLVYMILLTGSSKPRSKSKNESS